MVSIKLFLPRPRAPVDDAADGGLIGGAHHGDRYRARVESQGGLQFPGVDNLRVREERERGERGAHPAHGVQPEFQKHGGPDFRDIHRVPQHPQRVDGGLDAAEVHCVLEFQGNDPAFPCIIAFFANR